MKQYLNLGTYHHFPIYHDRRSASNKHILITGASGYGKSRCLLHIARELQKLDEAVVILDFASSFKKGIPRYSEDNIFSSEYLSQPFHGYSRGNISEIIQECDMLSNIWKLGSRQQSQLFSALKKLGQVSPDNTGNSFFPLLNWNYRNIPNADFPYLCYVLEENKNKELASRFVAVASLSKAKAKDSVPVKLWQIYNFPTVSSTVCPQLTELFLWGLWHKRTSVLPDTLPAINVIIDECQWLSWKQGSIVNQILQEGRKYGISLILATQSTPSASGNRQIIPAFQQAGLRMVFHPAINEATTIAKMICASNSHAIAEQLKQLSTGECFACGCLGIAEAPAREQFVKIKIPKEEDCRYV